MDKIDSKYIVLKYYAIPETASNHSFSIVIVERVKYNSAREIATREQGDTRRGERKSSNALCTATVLQSLVFFTTIYRFIFYEQPSALSVWVKILGFPSRRPSVRSKFAPV